MPNGHENSRSENDSLPSTSKEPESKYWRTNVGQKQQTSGGPVEGGVNSSTTERSHNFERSVIFTTSFFLRSLWFLVMEQHFIVFVISLSYINIQLSSFLMAGMQLLTNMEVIREEPQILVVHYHCQLVPLQTVTQLLYGLQEVQFHRHVRFLLWHCCSTVAYTRASLFLLFNCGLQTSILFRIYVLSGWEVLDEFLLIIVGYVDSLGDKSKRSVVHIKGRFSVTSENVDLAKVSKFGG